MTEKNLQLAAKRRDLLGKQVKQLRAQGHLPGVVYGFETDTTPITLDAKLFRKLYKEAGTNTLIDLSLDNKAVKVLVQDLQLNPVDEAYEHVDLYAVNMKQKVETEVPLEFMGVAPAVKELQGNFVANRHQVEIRALPSDIPQEIKVDIAGLITFEDMIRAKDLQIPANVELVGDPETPIAFVEEPISEEELKASLEEDKTQEEAKIAELGAEPEKPAEGEAPAEGAEGEAAAPAEVEAKKEE